MHGRPYISSLFIYRLDISDMHDGAPDPPYSHIVKINQTGLDLLWHVLIRVLSRHHSASKVRRIYTYSYLWDSSKGIGSCIVMTLLSLCSSQHSVWVDALDVSATNKGLIWFSRPRSTSLTFWTRHAAVAPMRLLPHLKAALFEWLHICARRYTSYYESACARGMA